MDQSMQGISSASSTEEDRIYAKVGWRLIPFLVLCYLVSYLDRVNVGFAKLQMLKDLGLSDAIYGLGAGIFFLGYFIFEVPSNLILHRVGAKVWIARIMITWGIISSAMMFTNSATTFYVLRFLLGVAEAGFFPGIVLYLTYWYPNARRGRMTTLFMLAVPLSGLVGGPISGWIMSSVSGHGLAGWQWLYLLEGLPAIVIGIIVLFYLDDRIEKAHWLTDSEKAVLTRNIEAEDQAKEEPSILVAMSMPRVWVMAFTYFGFVMGLYGVGFWLPTIIKNAGVSSTFEIGMLSAIPNLFAIIGMILIARSSDRMRERRWHLAIPAVVAALGLIWSTSAGSVTASMIALTIANVGIITVLPLFWSQPTAILSGAAAAAGIALINSVGNLAGFFSPSLVGWLKSVTGSTNSGMYLLAASLVVGALLALSQPAKLVNK
ncbi:MAG: MFS transporter [Bordetella sp.]|uniref:MFS transporter n=1 Tax=Bordetella sp. TaxID=28081 RepID=UPI003F7BD4DC